MITRYQRLEMEQIWSETNKYKSWLEIELLALEGYVPFLSELTIETVQLIRQKAVINLPLINQIESETKHDVIAFTRAISTTLGVEKKWIHFGLTSTDVVDSAQSLRLKQANDLLLNGLTTLQLTLKKLAKRYMMSYQIGRTHGVHAEITTFGYTLALWFDEISRHINNFKNVAPQVEVIKLSGAVGNYAHIPLEVQTFVAAKLKMAEAKIATQVLQRDRHATYLNTLAVIGGSIEKFALTLRLLQQTEISEVAERFDLHQKGSSAMPHKKNPISSENITGLSRLLRGYAVAGMENISLWHQRDISHSSVERVILPDATTLLDYILNRFNQILNNLIVDEQKMIANINLTHGLIFSQNVMLYLINNKNYSREQAYDQIQPLTQICWKKKLDFAQLLIKEKILTPTEVTKIFNFETNLKNVKSVFKRLKII